MIDNTTAVIKIKPYYNNKLKKKMYYISASNTSASIYFSNKSTAGTMTMISQDKF